MMDAMKENVLERLEDLHDYYDTRHDDFMEEFYNSESETQKNIVLSQRNYVAGMLHALELAMDIVWGVED